MAASPAEARRAERINAISRVVAGNNSDGGCAASLVGPGDQEDDALSGAVRKVAELCSKLSNEGVYLLGRCCTYPAFVRGISVVPAFIPQFDAVVRNPYAKEQMGEHASKVLVVRDTVMEVVMDTAVRLGKLTEAHVGALTWRLCQDPDALASARHDLWLWAWWQAHLNLTYVPVRTIQRYLAATSGGAGGGELAWDLALNHLVYAPRKDTDADAEVEALVTHKSIRACEEDIDQLFDDATVIAPAGLIDRTSQGCLAGLDEPQTRVVHAALTNPVFLLQGGAGVGKTTTMAAMVAQVAAEAAATPSCSESGLLHSLAPSSSTAAAAAAAATCSYSLGSYASSSSPHLAAGAAAAARYQVVCLAFTHKAKRCLSERLFGHAPLARYIDVGLVRVSTIHSFIQSVKTRASAAAAAGSGAAPAAPAGTFIVLDESSMVDIELMAELGRALRQAGVPYQLCMVGDEDQLAPVGRGEVFRALVSARRRLHHNAGPGAGAGAGAGAGFAVLTHCYRTDRPDLYEAYSSIRRGEMPRTTDHFAMTLTASDGATYSTVQALIAGSSSSSSALPLFITWQNRDVNRINAMVQASLLKGGFVGPNKFADFYRGDRVMYVGENEAEVAGGGALTNATMGRVLEARGLELVIEWDTESGPVRRLHKTGGGSSSSSRGAGSAPRRRPHGPPGGSAAQRTTALSIRDIRLAYCLTVHKAQGSEYDNVAVVCVEVPKMCSCLDRRWLYTAASRGKQRVQVIGTKSISRFIEAGLKDHEPLFLQALEGCPARQ